MNGEKQQQQVVVVNRSSGCLSCLLTCLVALALVFVVGPILVFVLKVGFLVAAFERIKGIVSPESPSTPAQVIGSPSSASPSPQPPNQPPVSNASPFTNPPGSSTQEPGARRFQLDVFPSVGVKRVSGITGHGVSLPVGQTAYVDLGTFNFPDSQGTIALWVAPSRFPCSHLLTKGFNGHSAAGFGMYLGIPDDGRLRLGTGAAGGDSFADSQAGAVRAGRWQHVAVTWGPDGVRFYVDGTLIPTVDGRGRVRAGANQDSRMPVALARWGALYYPEAAFKGEVDDLVIYDRMLTANEIAVAAKP